jgi:hypothetical protein
MHWDAGRNLRLLPDNMVSSVSGNRVAVAGSVRNLAGKNYKRRFGRGHLSKIAQRLLSELHPGVPVDGGEK